MADTKKTEITAVMAALKGQSELEKWAIAHPIKLTGGGTAERRTVAVTANAPLGLYIAVVGGCAGDGREHVTSDGDLMFNALNRGVQIALHNEFGTFEPAGYVFEAPTIGSRAGGGPTAQLKSTINELVATLVPLVKSGVLTIEQVPESSREQVAALIAA